MNSKGKLLINFVINSNDDKNLIAFLMPAHPNSKSLVNKKYFVKMQSEQYFENSDPKKTLFERYLFIKDNDTRDSFFDLCFYLLEEMNVIQDIKNQTCVDVALVEANLQSCIIAKNTEHASVQQKEVEELKFKQEKYDHRYDCDKLLKYFAAYWTKEDVNYEHYKKKFTNHSPFFTMMLSVIEDEEDEFVKYFHANINLLIRSYMEHYDQLKDNEKIMQDDLFILFRAAIKHNRRKIIACILDFESFQSLDFKFPHYKKANENDHHAALKLLENGYDLGDGAIPGDWVSEQVINGFLDSQIKVVDKDIVQLNSNVLLCSDDRRFKIKSKEDVDSKMLFCEHNGNLQFIVNNEALKDSILHPIVSTYINLKSYKYQRVYELNFILFFFLYMLPFGLLITYHSFDHLSQTFSAYFLRVLEVLCVASSGLLTIRELIQMIWVSKSWKEYFGKRTNQLELAMITLSWILLFGIFYQNIDEHFEYFSFLSTLFIMLSTIELLTMLPFKSMPIYMMMLKTVASTFLRFFYLYVFILFSFSISFCVIFRPKHVKTISENLAPLNDTAEDTSSSRPDENTKENAAEDDDVFQNFDTLIGSFFKTVLMLSGEYTIEPFTLSMTKGIIFFIFVIFSFILFNMLIGLATDDVQGIRQKAEMLNLRYESKKFFESAAKWKELFDKFE